MKKFRIYFYVLSVCSTLPLLPAAHEDPITWGKKHDSLPLGNKVQIKHDLYNARQAWNRQRIGSFNNASFKKIALLYRDQQVAKQIRHARAVPPKMHDDSLDMLLEAHIPDHQKHLFFWDMVTFHIQPHTAQTALEALQQKALFQGDSLKSQVVSLGHMQAFWCFRNYLGADEENWKKTFISYGNPKKTVDALECAYVNYRAQIQDHKKMISSLAPHNPYQ